jgi:6-phosphogluconolactonase (cycloisomerase 2 family)
VLSFNPNRILPTLALLLSWSLLIACGDSNNSSNNTGGTTPIPGSNQPGNTGGVGSISNATAPMQTRFLYGTSGESISGGRVEADGRITALNMPTDMLSGNIGFLPGTGGLVTSLATDSQGRFLYAVSVQTASFGVPIGNNGLSAFRIDRTTGALTMVTGSPFPMSTRGGDVVVAGGDKFVITDSGGTLTVYSIDQSTGGLTKVSSISGLGDRMVATWDGQFVIGEAPNGPVASHKVGSDGALTEVSRVEVQNRGRLFLSYSGKYLYSSGNDGITVLSVNPAGQLLSVNSAGQLAITQNNFANWRIVSTTRDDKFAFLATASSNLNAGVLQSASVDPATGAIVSLIGTPIQFATGNFPNQVTTSFDGKFVFVALSGSPLQTFTIQFDGTLRAGPVASGPFQSPEFFIQVP